MRVNQFVFLIVFTVFCTPSLAYDWSSNPGDGSPENPYHISEPNHLIAIGSNADLLDKHFILTNDIIFDPTNNPAHLFDNALIAPDQNNNNTTFDGTAFTGRFNGAGYSVTNLNMNAANTENDYLGLFGQIGQAGEVINLRMTHCYTQGNGNLFADCYYVGQLAGANNGAIVNCYSNGIVEKGYTVGGLVGFNAGSIRDSVFEGETGSGTNCGGITGLNTGEISSCSFAGLISFGDSIGGLIGFNQGTITSSHSAGDVQGHYVVGGVVGMNKGTIENCGSECNVTGVMEVGGLVGTNYHNSVVQDCYSVGSVAGGDAAGGFVGGNEGGDIRRCYAIGDVSGNDEHTGGFAGSNLGDILDCYSNGNVQGIHYAGGFTGTNMGLVANSYATGTVQSSYYSPRVGGFAAVNSGAVYLCYWDSENSGLSESDAGMAKTTLVLKQKATFKGWADGTWRIDEGNDYPRLAWENTDGEMMFEPVRSYGGGTGTLEDPYQIRTCEQFTTFGFFRSDLDKHFVLMNDLVFDPNDETLLNPIGTLRLGFTGTFDGRGHSISNVAYHGEYCRNYSGVLAILKIVTPMLRQ